MSAGPDGVVQDELDRLLDVARRAELGEDVTREASVRALRIFGEVLPRSFRIMSWQSPADRRIAVLREVGDTYAGLSIGYTFGQDGLRRFQALADYLDPRPWAQAVESRGASEVDLEHVRSLVGVTVRTLVLLGERLEDDDGHDWRTANRALLVRKTVESLGYVRNTMTHVRESSTVQVDQRVYLLILLIDVQYLAMAGDSGRDIVRSYVDHARSFAADLGVGEWIDEP